MISNSDFEKVIDCLPEGFTWGEALTPDIALHIVNAAESSRIEQLESQLTQEKALSIVKDEAIENYARAVKSCQDQLAEAKKDQARYCYAVENMLILSEEDGMFLVEKEAADRLIDAAIASKEQGK
jgi:hypothetical protein